MANPQHVALVRAGTYITNQWIEAHPNDRLDLSTADFSDLDLQGIWLSDANLSEVNFSGTNLNNSDLSRAKLHHARFFRALLRGAGLGSAEGQSPQFFSADLATSTLARARFYGGKFNQANLAGATLDGATLSCSFDDADLSEITAHGADLSASTFLRTRLARASFTNTNLSDVDFIDTTLVNAGLSDCDLRHAQFMRADFTGCSFYRSVLDSTLFMGVSFAHTADLDSVVHAGPSSITVDSLATTLEALPEGLRPEHIAFFEGLGIRREFLRVLPQRALEVLYDSCFISYGEPDRTFAENLRDRLRQEGVQCWMYSRDRTPGEQAWREIHTIRRTMDRVLIVCSAAGLMRDGLLRELEAQIDDNPNKIVPLSMDRVWLEPAYPVRRGAHDLKSHLTERNCIDFTPTDFDTVFASLLKTLRRARN